MTVENKESTAITAGISQELLAESSQAIKELLLVIATLRGEDGCPWDKQQTLSSLKKFVLEEANEVIAAIDLNHPAAICEELGDLLLQVILLSQIGLEEKQFDFAQVARGITAKMIFRHPYVFAHRTDLNLPKEMVAVWADEKEKLGKDWQELTESEMSLWWQASKKLIKFDKSEKFSYF